MTSILIKNARNIITMDDRRSRAPGGSIYIEGPEIKAVGAISTDVKADLVIDARGKVVIPGMVNCHHHLSQVLTKNVPLAQDKELFPWLVTLYEVWQHLQPGDLHAGAAAGLGELLKTGCTTAADHFYAFPRESRNLLNEEIQAAQELGIRFHPTRGSMSRGKSQGGLPPDELTQTEDEILADTRRAIESHHQPGRFGMVRVGVAPCSPFSVTTDLMKESAALARSYGVRLHTHLAETLDEENYCREIYGMRPLEYMESTGWIGPDVWYAHGIHFSDDEIVRIGAARAGVAHCPVSNMKLSSGACRVPHLLKAGAPVGLGVDGSASADSSNMLFEARVGYLLHKHAHGPTAVTAEDMLWLATRGGAAVLGRDDIGSIEVGKAADLVLIDVNQVGYAGALHDDVGMLMMTGSTQVVDTVIVNGQVVVQEGRLTRVDEDEVIRKANASSTRLLELAKLHTGKDFLQRG
ncbi:MAG TPA: 8-oxoguanine deaminase [Symbiobacteriaceae bacterium]|nr:8-oxoguanine deaminase [Symbiobacteriaceae bacterium]